MTETYRCPTCHRLGGGHAPFGFAAVDGKLTEQPDEQDAIHHIAALRNMGATLRGIASSLDADGYPCRGAKWNHRLVRRILSRQGVK